VSDCSELRAAGVGRIVTLRAWWILASWPLQSFGYLLITKLESRLVRQAEPEHCDASSWRWRHGWAQVDTVRHGVGV